jgi:hypothetical protein
MTKPSTETDRRQTARVRGVEQHGIRVVRIRPGYLAEIIDASAAGALLETSHRLLPGRSVELHMETDSDHFRVRGRIVRCAVVRVRAAVVFYRGAVAFDRHLPWFVHENGYAVPSAEQRPGLSGRAVTTPPAV